MPNLAGLWSSRMKKLILVACLVIVSTIGFSQTPDPSNPPAVTTRVAVMLPPVLNPSSNSISQAAQDFGKGFNDLGLNISVGGIEKFLIGLFIAGRFAMKYLLKNPDSKLYALAKTAALHIPTVNDKPQPPSPSAAPGTSANVVAGG